MPIKELSQERRIHRGGYLRLGTKAKNGAGFEYPTKSDHFIVDFENPEDAERFEELYGKEAKEVEICFASDDLEQVFPQYYKLYQGSGLLCKGTGEKATRFDIKAGTNSCVECPGPQDCKLAWDKGSGRGDKRKPGCKPLPSLQFFNKGIKGLHVFQINTTSRNSIINMNSGLAMLAGIRGQIAGVWVKLKLAEVPNAKHKGMPIQIFCLNLVVDCDVDQIIHMQTSFQLNAPPPQITDERDELLYPEGGHADENGHASPPIAKAGVVDTTATDESPAQANLARDEGVLSVFRVCGTPKETARALLVAAKEHNMGRETLIAAIYKKTGRADLCARHGDQTGPPPEWYPKPAGQPAPEPTPEPEPEPDDVIDTVATPIPSDDMDETNF